MIVLVNPMTKAPTAFEPGESTPHVFSGPYQNVAEVTEEWVKQERERLGQHVLSNYERWSRYSERIAEREASARDADYFANPEALAAERANWWWRWRHWWIRCTHPKGCKFCNWCGFHDR